MTGRVKAARFPRRGVQAATTILLLGAGFALLDWRNSASVEARTQGDTQAARVASPGHRSTIPARLGRASSVSQLPAPTPEERLAALRANPPTRSDRGRLRTQFERWIVEPHDDVATASTRQYIEELLRDFDVEPNDIRLSCGPTICRAQLAFDDLNHLRTLGRVPGMHHTLDAGDPEPLEHGVTIVLYWDLGTLEAPP